MVLLAQYFYLPGLDMLNLFFMPLYLPFVSPDFCSFCYSWVSLLYVQCFTLLKSFTYSFCCLTINFDLQHKKIKLFCNGTVVNSKTSFHLKVLNF